MFVCSFGIPLKTFNWSPELRPELWDFDFDRLSRPLRTRDNMGEGQQNLGSRFGEIQKYGTNRADIQRDATIVFAGLSQRADDL
jgi:hypothetical protein